MLSPFRKHFENTAFWKLNLSVDNSGFFYLLIYLNYRKRWLIVKNGSFVNIVQSWFYSIRTLKFDLDKLFRMIYKSDDWKQYTVYNRFTVYRAYW